MLRAIDKLGPQTLRIMALLAVLVVVILFFAVVVPNYLNGGGGRRPLQPHLKLRGHHGADRHGADAGHHHPQYRPVHRLHRGIRGPSPPAA